MAGKQHLSANERALIKQGRRYARSAGSNKIPLAEHYELGRSKRAFNRLAK